MSKEYPMVSVIMPVYNGKNYLSSSLLSVKMSDYPNFEFIVVDDNSTDSSADISREMADIVITLDAREGPAKARNLGVKTAKGDILLFVDADVAIYPDSISKIVRELETHPEIAAVFGSYDDTHVNKNFFSNYKNLFHHFVHQNSDTHARTFWAGCGAVRRELFLKAGGFSEVYSTPSIEDVEFGYKLVEDGRKIKLVKELKVTHLKKWSFISLMKSDIWYRAIPWTKLAVKSWLPKDLNFSVSSRISGIICFILMPFFVLIGKFIFIIPLCLFLLFLNRKLYSFFLKKRGIIFTLFSILFHWFYYFYSSAIFVTVGTFLFLKKFIMKR